MDIHFLSFQSLGPCRLEACCCCRTYAEKVGCSAYFEIKVAMLFFNKAGAGGTDVSNIFL